MGRIIRELLEFIFESLPPLDEVMGFLVRVLVRVWNKVELSHMVTLLCTIAFVYVIRAVIIAKKESEQGEKRAG